MDGPLAISPNEQVDFLRALRGGDLLFSEATLATVGDLLVLEETPELVLRGKTGQARTEGGATVLWLVGWVERGDARFYFATLILSGNPTRRTADARLEVTHRILANLGAL
jgi:beta-lactamase class D